ncbi:MAG: baseplate J/gp47 family protein [Caldilineaceae bacterium]|nr:baseplate J/gp47 family protein [Caldilineaceae bacterium]
MTEIYRISPDASFETVRRMLGQLHHQRVALELPEGWLELDNVARMRLLQRQAQIQHCEIALITRHAATRTAARQIGVPVFAHPEEAARDRWHMTPLLPLIDPHHPDRGLPDPPPWRRADEVQRRARPTLYQARQRRIKTESLYRRPAPTWMRWAGNVVMSLLIVAVLAGFSYYVLPAATITLHPGRVPLETSVQLAAVAGLDSPDLEERRLPARLIKADLQEQGRLPTSGTSQKPTDKSVGEVVFSNLGNSPVTVPKGTTVSTGTGTVVEFRTTTEAQIDGAVGARVTVPIEAVEPGTIGNVRANTINNVGGALRFRVRVNNSNGTAGGGSALVPVVAQADRDRLVEILLDQAAAKAYDALAAQLEPGEWLPPESVQTFLVAQSFDQYNDEEATDLSGSVRVLVQGMAVNELDANNVILRTLERQVPAQARLVTDSIRVQRLPGGDFASNTVTFTMTVAADYTTPIDVDEVRELVVGKPRDEAIQEIQDRWLVNSAPDIYLDPAWQGTLPSLVSRIQVRVEYGRE